MRARVVVFSVIGIVGVEGTALAATNFNVTNNFASSYVVGGVENPTLQLARGQTYTFTLDAIGHPFWITTARGAAEVGTNEFTNGVTGNGTSAGTVTFVVPASAPSTLFYQCGFHDIMGGTLNIVSPATVPSGGPTLPVMLAGLLLLVAVVALRKRTRD